jgi:MFS family permease
VLRAIRGIPLVCWALFAVLPLLQQSLMATSPVVPEVREAFDLSYAALGVFLAAAHIVRLICDLPAGEIATRFDGRRLLLICAVTGLVACLVGTFATSYWELLLSRGAVGAASAINQAVVLSWLVSLATVRNRGLVMGMSEAAFSTVATFSPPVSGLLATEVGWRAPFVMGTVGAALALLLGWFGTRGETPPDHRGHTDRDPAAGRGRPAEGPSAAAPSFRGLFPAGGGILITSYAATFAIFFGRHAFNQTYLPVVGGDFFGLPPPALGWIFGALALTSAFFTIGGAVIADRVGRPAFAVPSLVALFAVQASFLFVHDVGTFFVFFFLQVLGSASYALPTSLVGDALPPAYRALGMAGYRVVADVASVVGPLVVGVAFDYFGARGPLVMVLGVSGTCVALSVLAMRASRRPRVVARSA